MKNEKDIRDDEIRILGNNGEDKGKNSKILLLGMLIATLAILGCLALLVTHPSKTHTKNTPIPPNDILPYFEQVTEKHPTKPHKLGREVNPDAKGFCEIRDTTINDIPLLLYIPHNARMTLHVGRMNQQDTTVIYAAQAADVRRDNEKILGAFVLKGEPLAWGLSKKGFCASIDGVVTVGVADNSPLFEEATEREGYFFRQYPLVKDGVLIENEPKNKSERRAICDRMGEIFMVESLSKESFHDFAQALVDLGVDQAVYLVGSTAFGWAVDEHGEHHKFGEENYYRGHRRMPKNTSYIVWKTK
ncbi:MAG: hypothetical protein K2J00_07125 [Bacteroidaceae bacterium]|nr:hypothetical protein [Bacteroidaceae bacterium]